MNILVYFAEGSSDYFCIDTIDASHSVFIFVMIVYLLNSTILFSSLVYIDQTDVRVPQDFLEVALAASHL